MNTLILDCGMDFDGNGDKAEGKNPVADRPRHKHRLTGERALGYGGIEPTAFQSATGLRVEIVGISGAN